MPVVEFTERGLKFIRTKTGYRCNRCLLLFRCADASEAKPYACHRHVCMPPRFMHGLTQEQKNALKEHETVRKMDPNAPLAEQYEALSVMFAVLAKLEAR